MLDEEGKRVGAEHLLHLLRSELTEAAKPDLLIASAQVLGVEEFWLGPEELRILIMAINDTCVALWSLMETAALWNEKGLLLLEKGCREIRAAGKQGHRVFTMSLTEHHRIIDHRIALDFHPLPLPPHPCVFLSKHVLA